MRNPCKECDYYHAENNTCQSKKCCTGGDGYVTWWDRLWCKPYKYKAEQTEPQTKRRLPDYSYEADLAKRLMEQTEGGDDGKQSSN